jgi:hypothetical protein
MEELKDLVYLLDRYAVRDIDIITNPNKKKTKEDSRYWDFYTGIQKNRWKLEEDAARHFGYNSKSDKGFRRLKEGLKDRLINTILFIENNEKGEDTNLVKFQEMYKLFAASEILRRKGAYAIYKDVANRALNLSLELENLLISTHLSNVLRSLYSKNPTNRKDYERVTKIFEKTWPSFVLQTNLHDEYLTLSNLLINQKGYKIKYCEKVNSVVKKYEEYYGKKNELTVDIYLWIFKIFSCTISHDWQNGIRHSDHALKCLEESYPKGYDYLIIFGIQKASCQLMLGEYENAFETLDKYLQYVNEGKTTWFKNREIAAITSLYAGKYQQAWDLVQMATKHERFSTISEVDQETWRLYEGYLQLISRINKEEYWSKEDSAASKFRLTRLLNEMPLYSQDKRGGNIPMLILQILFYVTEMGENKKAFDEIANRVEALRKYNDRNLDPDEEHVRSDCFISLLTLLPKYLYKPLDLAKAAHPLLAKMKGYQTDIIDNSFEVEVVPYERQWEWIMRYVNELSEKK